MVLEEKRGDFHKTNLEEKAEDLLKELGVTFIPQFPSRLGYLLDFAVFLSNGRIIDLETDGHRWHSSKRAKKRDNFRNYMLRREGWKIYRVRERSFDEDFERFKMECLS